MYYSLCALHPFINRISDIKEIILLYLLMIENNVRSQFISPIKSYTVELISSAYKRRCIQIHTNVHACIIK